MRSPDFRAAASVCPPALVAASLAGWTALLGFGHELIPQLVCTADGAVLGGWYSAAAVLLPGQPGDLGVAWALMVLAMMAPALGVPLRHVWRSSLARRRALALALFGLGYLGVWSAAGLLLLPAAAALLAAAAGLAVPAPLLAGALALAWHFSRPRRASRDRCHRLPSLAAFGAPAVRGNLGFGLSSGAWCVATCWALMLVTLVADSAHFPLMALAMFVVLAERLPIFDKTGWRASAWLVRWRARPSGTAARNRPG